MQPPDHPPLRITTPDKLPLFGDFFFAGFEGTACRNALHQWIDQIEATQHDTQVDADYRRLREVGIHAARDCIRWPQVDRHSHYEFTSVDPFVAASQRHGIQVVWDLFHYGYPEDLDPFSEAFPRRFEAYSSAVANYVRSRQDPPYYFTPVNEPSFLAWAGAEVGRFGPHLRGRGPEFKLALVRAAIAGINAIRSVIPEARMVNVDPLCHVIPGREPGASQGDAGDFNGRAVYEAWDMISGRILPELGGSPAHLDIVGVNYYWTNQWEIGREEQPLALDDPARVPLRDLLREVWTRYGAEILLTETAHAGEMRPIWLREVAADCEAALDDGIPLRGVCLYPILGMPEWHDRERWARMGLWDLVDRGGVLDRQPYGPLVDALCSARRRVRRFAGVDAGGMVSRVAAPAEDSVRAQSLGRREHLLDADGRERHETA
ncbi:MAG TPA: glycoside hydrolase [Opitutaceae bacterium]|nr:glycoside hydrolase [Opitutaceae bacterium]